MTPTVGTLSLTLLFMHLPVFSFNMIKKKVTSHVKRLEPAIYQYFLDLFLSCMTQKILCERQLLLCFWKSSDVSIENRQTVVFAIRAVLCGILPLELLQKAPTLIETVVGSLLEMFDRPDNTTSVQKETGYTLESTFTCKHTSGKDHEV